jgi:hypothetical protein
LKIAILLDGIESWYKALVAGLPPPLPDAPFLKDSKPIKNVSKKKATDATVTSTTTTSDTSTLPSSSTSTPISPNTSTPTTQSTSITTKPSTILPTPQNPSTEATIFDLFDSQGNPLRLNEHLTANGKEFIQIRQTYTANYRPPIDPNVQVQQKGGVKQSVKK